MEGFSVSVPTCCWPSTVTFCAPASAELKFAVSPANFGTVPPLQFVPTFQLVAGLLPGVTVGSQFPLMAA